MIKRITIWAIVWAVLIPTGFAINAHAQTTIDTAIVIPTFIAPNPDGGIHIEGMAIVKIGYGSCEAATASAEAAMHAREAELATAQGRASWVPMSFARCYQERWSVYLTPTTATVQPMTCVRQYGEGFDWFSPCP
jgi:hypothetical protein